MIAGIVLLPVGFVAAAVGGAIAGVSEGECIGDSHRCSHIVPILWGIGSAMMISGIVLVSIGRRGRVTRRRG